MSLLRYVKNRISGRFLSGYWEETHKSYGRKNPDKTFYIIRRSDTSAGLFSQYINILGHINYAVGKGWIPVVDMQNYRNAYTNLRHPGHENSWEYFFRQPVMQISMKEIYRSRNVVLSRGGIMEDMPDISMEFLMNRKRSRFWRELAKRYMPVKEEIRKAIEEEREKLFKGESDKDILGVLLRGTDYTSLRPSGHPVQPSIDEAISCIMQLMEKNKCHYIYLATEDEYILCEMIRVFGDKLKYSNVPRYKHNVNKKLHKIRRSNTDDYIRKGINYLIPIGVLAQCGFFFGGRTSGTVGALIMGMGYREAVFWDKGLYE